MSQKVASRNQLINIPAVCMLEHFRHALVVRLQCCTGNLQSGTSTSLFILVVKSYSRSTFVISCSDARPGAAATLACRAGLCLTSPCRAHRPATDVCTQRHLRQKGRASRHQRTTPGPRGVIQVPRMPLRLGCRASRHLRWRSI